MRNWFVVLALLLAATVSVDAQRVAYVDVEKILEAIPEYKEAQADLDQTAAKWKQDIAQEYAKIEKMYKKYQAEQVLLSETARQQREEEIVNKEKQVREMQKQKFGPEGALFQKRQQLVKPLQDKVYDAINKYASDRGYDFIFDKSDGATILFASPRLDKTEDILKKLGF